MSDEPCDCGCGIDRSFAADGDGSFTTDSDDSFAADSDDSFTTDDPFVDDGPNPGPEAASERETARWIDGAPASDDPLPRDVRTVLGRFVGDRPIETLGDAVSAIRRRLGGGSIGVGDLCHADGPTPHRGVVDGDTYHFQCFYDAVVLAELTDSRAAIRTEAPGGAAIEARATGTGELTVTPADAAMSFGIATDATPPEAGDRSVEEAYAAICPYVKAFPNRAAYEEWAARVPAATVGTPLANATEIAALFAE